MDVLEAIHLVDRVEQDGTLTSCRMYGIDVWPVIRVRLVGDQVRGYRPPTGRLSMVLNLVGGLAGLCAGLLRAVLRHPASRRERAVFFSHAECLAWFDNQLCDRFCDPIAEKLVERGIDSTIFDYAPNLTVDRTSARARLSTTTLLLVAKTVSMAVAALCAAIRRGKLRSIERRLEEVGLSQVIGIGRLNRLLAYIWCSRCLFSVFLRLLQPRLAFVCTYYNSTSMAFVSACRRNGVPVFDIQHGIQGATHRAYRAWPSDMGVKSTCLPDGYWCWDSITADNLRGWARDPIRVVVGGNVWNEYVLQRAAENGQDGCQLDREEFPGKRVLVTIQPIREPIRPLLLEAIRRSPAEVTWTLRMHPATTPAQAEQVRSLVHRVRADRVRVQLDVDVPLPLALMCSDLHVTEYSSVVVEAAEIGVTTVLLSELAPGLFGGYLANGSAIAVTTATELLEAVSERSRRSQGAARPASIDGALDKILA